MSEKNVKSVTCPSCLDGENVRFNNRGNKGSWFVCEKCWEAFEVFDEKPTKQKKQALKNLRWLKRNVVQDPNAMYCMDEQIEKRFQLLEGLIRYYM